MWKMTGRIAILAAASAADNGGGDDMASGDDGGSADMGGGNTPPFGQADDVAKADALWQEIQGYDGWNLMSGTTAAQASAAPHTDFASIHVNTTAAAGASDIDAFTVMKKMDDLNDDDIGNWFYAKFKADGTLAQNPAGMPCRAGAGGDDFVFSDGD